MQEYLCTHVYTYILLLIHVPLYWRNILNCIFYLERRERERDRGRERGEREREVSRTKDNPQESQTIYLFSYVFWVAFCINRCHTQEPCNLLSVISVDSSYYFLSPF